tara:strand:- start:124 stop:411 length:288 start_codon:yes stop_codon:yes gene_type:complete
LTKKNITKREISESLSQRTGFPLSLSKKLVTNLLNIMSDQIKKDNLIIKNLGSFNLIVKNERIGRNPKTKEEFIINKRKTISFSSSKNLTDYLNE